MTMNDRVGHETQGTAHDPDAAGHEAVGRDKAPTRAEKGEVIGGGYIIAHRNTNGRIRTSKMPFEHPTQAAALDEAARLSEKHPGRTYVILAVAGTVLNDKVA